MPAAVSLTLSGSVAEMASEQYAVRRLSESTGEIAWHGPVALPEARATAALWRRQRWVVAVVTADAARAMKARERELQQMCAELRRD